MPADPLLPPGVGIGESHRRAARVADRETATTSIGLEEPIEVAYQRLYPRLVRLAFLLLDTREQAEEAVQDAFAKAYPRWARVENAEAYMRIAVVNNCRVVQRRRAIVRRFVPVRHEDASMNADHVADVVRALPTRLRQVVVLRYYLQLSDAEIAETLHMPAGTVKSTLHRARTHLREVLT